MNKQPTLESCLTAWQGKDATRIAVATSLIELAKAATEIATIIARGPLGGDLGGKTGAGVAGEEQKALDLIANDLCIEAAKRAPIAAFASEEEDDIRVLNPGKPLLMAVDPLDGSSNIDTNVSIGTIFSILPCPKGSKGDSKEAFFQKGANQLAGGYFAYGPHNALMLTIGEGVDMYVLDPQSKQFLLAQKGVTIKEMAYEFGINMSNSRHWSAPTTNLINDCLLGKEGSQKKDFNMRWIGSMVADCHRIFIRGGIYLYPGDRRPTYEQGRLRLLYEAFPIAFLMEQAGAAASSGPTDILELTVTTLHQRIPLIFGSKKFVELACSHY